MPYFYKFPLLHCVDIYEDLNYLDALKFKINGIQSLMYGISWKYVMSKI